MPLSSHQYAKPLTIELVQSGHATIIVMVVHGLAASALLASSLPAAVQVAGLAIIAGSVYLVMFRLRYLRRLVWQSDGNWLLIARDGREVIAQLTAESVALPFVTLLNFRSLPRGHHFSVAVFPNAYNADTLRRLRVRLRVDAAARNG